MRSEAKSPANEGSTGEKNKTKRRQLQSCACAGKEMMRLLMRLPMMMLLPLK
jgi:hypothetical protein